MKKLDLLKVKNKLHLSFDSLLNKLSITDPVRANELTTWIFDKLAKDDGEEYTENNLRVATSLAFENLTGNMPSELIFEKVFNRKNEYGDYFITLSSKDAAHVQFHKATHFDLKKDKIIDDNDYKILHEFYKSLFSTEDHPVEGYARCLSLPVYFNYLVTMDKDYENNSTKLSNYLILNKFKESEYNLEVPFPKIPAAYNVNMRGGKPLGWVAPYAAVSPIIELGKPPVELAQRLGINVKNTDEIDPQYYDILVLIKYDKKFSQKVYQPAVIHADWNSGGFVSYFQNDECYGLTCNCCVINGETLLERVHISFPVITDGPGAYKHKAMIVGRVNEAVGLNYEVILKETVTRFKKI